MLCARARRWAAALLRRLAARLAQGRWKIGSTPGADAAATSSSSTWRTATALGGAQEFGGARRRRRRRTHARAPRSAQAAPSLSLEASGIMHSLPGSCSRQMRGGLSWMREQQHFSTPHPNSRARAPRIRLRGYALCATALFFRAQRLSWAACKSAWWRRRRRQRSPSSVSDGKPAAGSAHMCFWRTHARTGTRARHFLTQTKTRTHLPLLAALHR